MLNIISVMKTFILDKHRFHNGHYPMSDTNIGS